MDSQSQSKFDIEALPIPLETPPPKKAGFDDGAPQFWSVFVDDARRYDETLIGNWKQDMKGVILFAGLFAAALTPFVVESVKSLRPDPVEENAYYSRQSVVLLAQISAQLAASGSPVPSSIPLPPPLPEFRATQSDIRVNVYWLMSLVFSLSAALAATLVQQWGRVYRRTSQRYSHPSKSARIRQYLYEGIEGWHMEIVVNLVPALIHISLFLFFVGLAEALFAVDIATATATTAVISICALCYLFTIVIPVPYPQSPYQSPLSGMVWYLYRRIRAQKDKISTNMMEGRMQLATNFSEYHDRNLRDVRSIEWVVHNLTEDSEVESLIRNIPSSLNSDGGKDVWKVVEDENGKGILEHGEQADFLSLLDHRITHLLKTCTDLGALSDKTERERRAHACIGASLSLLLFVKYRWTWLIGPGIQTMAQVLCLSNNIRGLRDVPRVSGDPPIMLQETPTVLRSGGPRALRDKSTVLRNVVTVLPDGSTADFESTSSIRWTCMSIIFVSTTLQGNEVPKAASEVIDHLTKDIDWSSDDEGAKAAKAIDNYLKTCWDSAKALHKEFVRAVEADKGPGLQMIVQDKMREITTLDDMWNASDWAEETNKAIEKLTQTLKEVTGSVLHRLPDTVLPWQLDSRQVPEKDTRSTLPYVMPRFIPPRSLLHRMWLCVPVLHTISTTGWEKSRHMPDKLTDLSAPELQVSESWMAKLMHETPQPMEIQLCRLKDLRAGGLFYSIEIFISAIKSSQKAALLDTTQELYKETFHFITRARKWQESQDYERSEWRVQLIDNLLRQVLPASGIPPSEQVPEYIIDVFLPFAADVLANKTGSHIQSAIGQIKVYRDRLQDNDTRRDTIERDVLSKLEQPGA